ncbi:50S ribosomal protein L24 [Candidatus Wolfebacteria bacterium RBG_13_41_7]|uniref:Large ribosomal subunit protein uL24 n=1 Tax=Candidatus Wolfebacteria bacterium RBG_13_41_7 TaxID=1802554 RepID=A0A1F8DMD5_9BACT|nr:MAG: 50S ribosomal protein L24 [Candidatus Wolfebacteria bacterium RBG_13_41_7]
MNNEFIQIYTNMNIHKNDNVKIIVGKDKNKAGKILKVLLKKDKILIDGLNLYKKHIRPKRQGEKGETVLVPRPINVSNVMLVCPACGRAVRTNRVLNKGKKTRTCKKCGAMV